MKAINHSLPLILFLMISSLWAQGTVFFQEDFSGPEVGSIPTGWTTTSNVWQVRATSDAGGESPELRFNTYTSGVHRVYTSAIDISTASDLELVFLQKSDDLDDPGPYTLSVQVSNNATDWQDVWTEVDPANIVQQMTVLPLANFATWDTIYISWVFSGAANDHDNWWIDDIILYQPTAYPGIPSAVYPADAAQNILSPLTLEWAQGLSAAPDGWDFYFGTEYPPPFIEDLGEQTSYSTDELTYSATYYWQAIPYNVVGSPDNCPIWSFTTGPNPQITTPTEENFDSVSQPNLPYGWRKIVENTSSSANPRVETSMTSSPRSAPNHVVIGTNSAPEQNVILISPPTSGLSSSRIRFWLKSSYLPNAGGLIIGTLTDAFDSSTFTEFATIPVSSLSTAYQEFVVSFEEYPGDDEFIGFKHAGAGGFSAALYIDDFSYEELPGNPAILTDVNDIVMRSVENISVSDYSIQITNDGTGTLMLEESAIGVTGIDADAFSFDSNALPLMLAEGESATLNLIFNPTSPGSKYADLVMNGNAANAPYSIELEGISYPTGTAVLGHGTDTGTSMNEGPLNIFFAWQRAQMVYTADEINANGLSGSNMMTHFGYFVESAPNSPITNFSIKMKHTTATNCGSHDNQITNHNIVYQNSSYMPEAGDYDVIQLDTPFGWNGIDNILVEICFGEVDDTSGSGITRNYSAPASSGFRSVRSYANITQSYTNQVRNWKPQAMMTFSGPAEGPWPNLAHTMHFNKAIGHNSIEQANLTLYNTGNENLTYSLNTSNYPGMVTTNPASGTLLPGMSSEIEVSFNSAGFEHGEYAFDIIISHNADIDEVVVPCKVKILPNNLLVWEDFSSWLSPGWQIATSLSETNWTSMITERAGGSYPEAVFNQTPLLADGTQRMISPAMNTSGFSNVYLEFKHSASTYNNLYQIKIETSTDLENWTVVEDFPNTGFSAYTYDTHINNNDVGSDTFYIAWTFVGNSFYVYNWNIDEVVISGGEDNGEISGTVTLNHQGILMETVLMAGDQITNPNTQGHYSFSVYPGTYYLAAHLAGYENIVIREIQVGAGQNVILDIDLQWIEPVLYPATDLSAIVQDFNSVQLDWEAPNIDTQELYYHEGYDGLGIGTNEPVEAVFAIRFTPDELTDYVGWSLDKVSFVLHTMEFNTAGVQIYEGGSYGDPGTLIYESDVTDKAISGFWIDERLDEPITILPDTEYWIGYYLDATGGYPAACDSGPAVTGKGDWLYTGDSWVAISSAFDLDVNWIINGTITSPQDREADSILAGKSNLDNPAIISRWPVSHSEYTQSMAIQKSREEISLLANRDHYAFTVYRNGEVIGVLGAHQLSFTDNNLAANSYEYAIEANYTEGSILNVQPVTVTVELPAPTDFCAAVDGQNVLLSWSAPITGRSINSYNVYMDDELLTTVEALGYTVEGLDEGVYSFCVAALYSGEHEGDVSTMQEVEIEPVSNTDLVNPVTALLGNYPNPFNPSTTIRYSIKEPSEVKIKIYNAKGQMIRTLVDTHHKGGIYTAVWDGKDTNGKMVGNGLFFYRMQSKDYNKFKKMILMK